MKSLVLQKVCTSFSSHSVSPSPFPLFSDEQFERLYTLEITDQALFWRRCRYQMAISESSLAHNSTFFASLLRKHADIVDLIGLLHTHVMRYRDMPALWWTRWYSLLDCFWPFDSKRGRWYLLISHSSFQSYVLVPPPALPSPALFFFSCASIDSLALR